MNMFTIAGLSTLFLLGCESKPTNDYNLVRDKDKLDTITSPYFSMAALACNVCDKTTLYEVREGMRCGTIPIPESNNTLSTILVECNNSKSLAELSAIVVADLRKAGFSQYNFRYSCDMAGNVATIYCPLDIDCFSHKAYVIGSGSE